MMWELSGSIAWVVAAALFLWLAWDFFRVNVKYDEKRPALLARRRG